jgi:hypothetical protein
MELGVGDDERLARIREADGSDFRIQILEQHGGVAVVFDVVSIRGTENGAFIG